MILRRVRLWNVRGVADLDVAFERGVNLVVGPNESGKSTLVLALRFGLFESHQGFATHKRMLQGWHTSESPRIAIEFEIDGVGWTLEKRFLKGSYARLQGGGATLRDEDAEQKVRMLLGARPKGRAARDEELGLWPLLCVEQGRAGKAPHEDLHDEARGTLQSRLAAELGEIVAGRLGQALLARARQEAGRYFTPRQHRPTGELAAAKARLEAARAALEQARARRQTMREAAARLERAEHLLVQLDERIAEAARRSELAQARAREVRELDGTRSALAAQLEALGLRRQVAERAAEERRQREARRAALAAQATDLEAELARCTARLASLQQAQQAAQAAVHAAERAHDEAVATERAAQHRAERARLREALVQARAAVERAQALAAEVQALQADIDANTLDPDAIAALRAAAARRNELHARLQGASARVRIRAKVPLEVRGERLEPGQERQWTCSAPERFDLPQAQIEVVPGGADLPALRESFQEAEHAFERALDRHGVADMAAAEERAASRAALERRLQGAREGLRALAPRGLEALRATVQELTARAEALGASEAAQGAEVDGHSDAQDGLHEALQQALQQAGAQIERARAAAEAASTALRQARAEHEMAREALGQAERAQQTLAQQQSEIAGALRQLNEALAATAPQPELDAEAQRARSQWQASADELAALDQRRRALGGDRALEEADAAARALEALHREQTAIAAERQRARAELDVLGGQGLHEAVLAAEGEVALATSECERIGARAEAARRLVQTLEAAHDELQTRLSEPVLRRVRPYLADVFGEVDLALSESWQVLGLRNGDLQEPFEDLSGGAREQLGVLVRLALAEVLAGPGTLPVVLDDPLVHSDAERQAAMRRVLLRASRTLQVIVLTCHGRAFEALAPAHRVLLQPIRPRVVAADPPGRDAA